MKANTQNWLDGEVLEKLNSRDKVFQKFKKFRLHIGKELSKKAKYEALKVTVTTKKQPFFKEKISESIGNSTELWESLKYLGMPKETLISNFSVMEDNGTLTYDTRSSL